MAWVGSHASSDLRLTKTQASHCFVTCCGPKPYNNEAFGGFVVVLGRETLNPKPGEDGAGWMAGFEMSGSGMSVWKVAGAVLPV